MDAAADERGRAQATQTRRLKPRGLPANRHVRLISRIEQHARVEYPLGVKRALDSL
jgi:hypothetical protein